jgi:predicted amidophosphoribosyltransferase
MEQQICPSCGAALRHTSGVEWVCDHCGNVYHHEEGVSCPRCKALNPEAAKYCFQCGAHLVRTCPSCHQENPLSAEYCTNCGVALDIVTVLMMRLQDQDGESAVRRAELAASAKDADQRYSEEIRRDLERREQQRLAELDALKVESRRQQRVISTMMIAAGVVLIVIVVVSVILAMR